MHIVRWYEISAALKNVYNKINKKYRTVLKNVKSPKSKKTKIKTQSKVKCPRKSFSERVDINRLSHTTLLAALRSVGN